MSTNVTQEYKKAEQAFRQTRGSASTFHRAPWRYRGVARLVHKEYAGLLKFARVWGSAHFDGQHWAPTIWLPMETRSNCTRSKEWFNNNLNISHPTFSPSLNDLQS